jgi:hypothetical protein
MARPAQSLPEGATELSHCATCGQGYRQCGTPWPPSVHDVAPTPCRLPLGHRSEEHWHPSLWPGTPDLLWFDGPEHEPDLEGPA